MAPARPSPSSRSSSPTCAPRSPSTACADSRSLPTPTRTAMSRLRSAAGCGWRSTPWTSFARSVRRGLHRAAVTASPSPFNLPCPGPHAPRQAGVLVLDGRGVFVGHHHYRRLSLPHRNTRRRGSSRHGLPRFPQRSVPRTARPARFEAVLREAPGRPDPHGPTELPPPLSRRRRLRCGAGASRRRRRGRLRPCP